MIWYQATWTEPDGWGYIFVGTWRQAVDRALRAVAEGACSKPRVEGQP